MNLFKTLLSAFVVVLLLASCGAVKSGIIKESTGEGISYEYVDIDPATIAREWQEVTRAHLNQYFLEICYTNPDEEAIIQYATVIVCSKGIAGYSYMIRDKINVCQINPETGNYESVWDILSDISKKRWYSDYNTYFDLASCS